MAVAEQKKGMERGESFVGGFLWGGLGSTEV